MKPRFKSSIFFTLLLLAAVTSLTGCATTATDQSKTGLTQGGLNSVSGEGCKQDCELKVIGKKPAGQ